MDKCIFCNKEYTIRGIKLHINKCKLKNYNVKLELSQIIESKKVNSLFNKLPDELIIYIKSFIIYKDDFCSYKRYCNNLFNLSNVSKQFNKIILQDENIYNLKKGYINEYDTVLCKTSVLEKYDLTQNNVENDIKYKLVKNPYYRNASPMKMYHLSDILDFFYNKYHTKKNYERIMDIEMNKKNENNDKNNIMKDKRKINYNSLFEKHNLINDISIYNLYYDDYVKKGSPGIKNIENNILIYKEKILRNNLLKNKLQSNNYENTDISNKYLNSIDNISLEDAYNSIRELKFRKQNIKVVFTENNIDYNSNINLHNEGVMMNNYIYKNNIDINEVVKFIVDKIERKQLLIDKLKQNGLKLRNDSELCSKYINNNDNSLEYVVNTMIEMDFYFKYTEYSSEFNKEKPHKYYNNNYNKYGYDDDDYCNYDYILASSNAKNNALHKWCKKYNSYEEALNHKLPISLYDKVLKIFEKKAEMDLIIYKKKVEKENIEMNKNDDKIINDNKIIFIDHKIKIEKFEKNIVKCLCNNIPSPICGFCINCCALSICNRHNKKNNIV